ncbi:hypothetical protein BO83DRAFT_379504 [Aspergillus eucalypticola CBS 122712]|uniref:C6 transcription factor n=1 Tax=Aspergillus eucalypticola (strain CBS 122712 / IBT 29274) TaxID=1448314 RepID=A0A317V9N9_ASPEC|nr:uncharacterized protein BO83DRAFT_379504 [Aspergillus eucalypticola CBS 122712]PWY70775.1 hypothetical protein BO83DRAFT_379504 [Aspergillus eucalypticola CBS 122712]
MSSHVVNESVPQEAGYEGLARVGQFNTQHLRLLLTWTTSTCHTISRINADARIWQENIPHQALSCPSLLHDIFAVSALHLALSSDCERAEKQALIEDAEAHQSEAIKMIMEFDNQLESSKLFESFVLSSLLVGSAFSFPLAVATHCETEGNMLDELIGVFILIRKMMSFSTPIILRIQESELCGLLLKEETQSSPSQSSQEAIASLHELLNTTYSQENENHRAFADTIDCLENLLGRLDGAGEIVSWSFNWICEVPAAFIVLLQEHNPLALVILAHYCVVLHQLRDRWWIASWGQRVLDIIAGILGPAWKSSIAWPVHAVKGQYQ